MRSALYLSLLLLLACAGAAQVLPSDYVPLGGTCAVFDAPIPGNSIAYVPVRGLCNIPPEANAVAWTVKVSDAAGPGSLKVFDSGILPAGVFEILDYKGCGRAQTMTVTRLCHPALECSGVDVGIQPTTGARVRLVAIGYFQPAP